MAKKVLKKVCKVIIGGSEYTLKLSAGAVVALEEKYGSLIEIFEDMNKGNVKISVLIDIFASSFEKYHGSLTRAERLDLYDDYMDENGSNAFSDILMELMETGGYVAEEDTTEKN
jgi:hypothetical protein